MTTLFAGIDDMTVIGGGGLLVTASVPVDEAIAATAAMPIAEMAGDGAAGKLRSCGMIKGVLRITAEIWDRIAVQKLSERVYRGLALIGFAAGNELTIERAALVDHPDALTKSRGAVAASLYLNGVTKMSLPSTRAAAPAANPFSKIEVGTNSPTENERAVQLIKYVRSPLAGQVKLARDADFFNWLQARAGR
ncbi:MAG TPA: hypothetical protein VGM07_05150 [Stellaceae bacterium]|jgi:hypothetical protein